MEPAVSILLGLFQTSLFTLQNTFTEITFYTHRVFDETLYGNLV
jgi:hypothetical protein